MPLLEEQFRSIALENERTIWLRIPANPTQEALPLLLFPDGEIYREQLDAEAVLDRLVAQGEIEECLAVFVSHISPDHRFRELPAFPPFATFVLDELLPWIEKCFAVDQDPLRRTMLGLSYSGLAAAYVAFQSAGRIGQVIAQSGSFWSEGGHLIDLFSQCNPVPIRFYLEVGSEETQDYLKHRPDLIQQESQLLANRRFRTALLRQGYAVEYREIPGGTHHPNSWRNTLPHALMWALSPDCRSGEGL